MHHLAAQQNLLETSQPSIATRNSLSAKQVDPIPRLVHASAATVLRGQHLPEQHQPAGQVAAHGGLRTSRPRVRHWHTQSTPIAAATRRRSADNFNQSVANTSECSHLLRAETRCEKHPSPPPPQQTRQSTTRPSQRHLRSLALWERLPSSAALNLKATLACRHTAPTANPREASATL